MTTTQIRTIVLSSVVAGMIGCGQTTDPNAREVFPAFGSITFKGEPIPDASVRLHPVNPPEDGKPVFVPRGRVDETGVYSLTTYTADDGAPPGEYRVSVSWVGPLKGVSEDDEDKLKERLPRKYTSAETSGLQVTVSEGENFLPELALN